MNFITACGICNYDTNKLMNITQNNVVLFTSAGQNILKRSNFSFLSKFCVKLRKKFKKDVQPMEPTLDSF